MAHGVMEELAKCGRGCLPVALPGPVAGVGPAAVWVCGGGGTVWERVRVSQTVGLGRMIQCEGVGCGGVGEGVPRGSEKVRVHAAGSSPGPAPTLGLCDPPLLFLDPPAAPGGLSPQTQMRVRAGCGAPGAGCGALPARPPRAPESDARQRCHKDTQARRGAQVAPSGDLGPPTCGSGHLPGRPLRPRPSPPRRRPRV